MVELQKCSKQCPYLPHLFCALVLILHRQSWLDHELKLYDSEIFGCISVEAGMFVGISFGGITMLVSRTAKGIAMGLVIAGSNLYGQAEMPTVPQEVKNTYYEIMDKDLDDSENSRRGESQLQDRRDPSKFNTLRRLRFPRFYWS